MTSRRLITAGFGLTLLFAAIVPAGAQVGEQPVRIIFPYAAGGSGDTLSRLIADKLRAGLNRTVIVENRTGAGGRIGVQAVKGAAPDGSTLLLTPIAPVAVYQHSYKSLGYDPIADFSPVSQLTTFDFAVAVGPRVPVKTLGELVAWAKANPGDANYGTPAAGTLPHFLGALFAQRTGLDLRHVGYRGSAAALNDLVGGHIAMVVTTTSDLMEMHKSGRVHVLATSGPQRSPFLPDVPTFAEQGYELQASGWYALFAPAKTPPDTITRINQIVVEAVNTPEVGERLLAMGLQPTGTSAAELAAIQKRDAAFWAPAVKASGFTAED
ncbi:Bug family tripartite tricarboxylate transporter substrate binding protein [Bradyrhizobium sp. LHD-71]|uniref:Bug family tripartite tricarboxylate transporter substrate binding protein n=1 Tax=Bradyrhizobium sp. LHD-71 TaxID=3072141 RepID=UPI00280F5E07|nr:Bug family tripartite tricarboxylate transporter substrate binding protein [Bradyrhizobium sp. LHD-71]MDQ8730468.1 Bug family tripartite tricarboxylate transporter substrate binding protein [Bradyrhizobium sp. LHD-71]